MELRINQFSILKGHSTITRFKISKFYKEFTEDINAFATWSQFVSNMFPSSTRKAVCKSAKIEVSRGIFNLTFRTQQHTSSDVQKRLKWPKNKNFYDDT